MKVKIPVFLIALLLISNVAVSMQAAVEKLISDLNHEEEPMKKFNLYNDIINHFKFDDPDSALFYGKQQLELGEVMGVDSLLYQANFDLAEIYKEKSKYAKSLTYFEECLRLLSAEIPDYKRKESYILNHIGIIYQKQGEFFKALEFYNRSLDVKRQIGDNKAIVVTLANIGGVYLDISSYEKALEYLIKSLKLQDEIAYDKIRNKTLNNIAATYIQLNQYDKALHIFEKSFDLFKDEPRDMVMYYVNVGAVYEKKGDDDSAIDAYNKALEILEKNEFKELKAITLMNVGVMKLKTKKLIEARDCFIQSLSDFQEINDKLGTAKSFSLLGSVYFEMTNYKLSIENHLRAVEYAVKTNNREVISGIYKELSKAFEKQGDYIESLEYLNMHLDMKDDLFESKSGKIVQDMQIQYEILEKEKEIELLEKENNIRKLQLSKKNFLIIILIVFSLLIFSYTVLIYRKKKFEKKVSEQLISQQSIIHDQEKERLNAEIATKDKELTTSVIYLARKNEVMNKVSGSLSETIKDCKAQNQKAIFNLIKELRSEINNEIWEEFEARFNHVHDKFYDNLNEEFPDLTPNEKRLCAFLRLNMSTKDISSITHQTVSSINLARTRLRKKLGITNTEADLIAFLSKY